MPLTFFQITEIAFFAAFTFLIEADFGLAAILGAVVAELGVGVCSGVGAGSGVGVELQCNEAFVKNSLL